MTHSCPTGITPRLVVVMGVAGSGKTLVAEGLCSRLGWPFQEGDDLHPPQNIAKMSAGEPLTDEDRLRSWRNAGSGLWRAHGTGREAFSPVPR